MIKNVREESFRSEVTACNSPVLVEFYADWCGPCKIVEAELEKFAEENSDVSVVKVNVDDDNNLAEKYGVSNVPCMILFSSGEPIKTIVGYRTKQQLKAIITEE